MTETVDYAAQIAELRGKQRAQRAVKHQAQVLLPQLMRKRDRLEALGKRVKIELGEVSGAMTDIAEGRITTYLVRRPPTRKAKAPKSGGG